MFDNLRQQSADGVVPEESTPEAMFTPARRSGPFLGLTPQQWFILSLMLFLNITVLGFFALLAFEKIVLPF